MCEDWASHAADEFRCKPMTTTETTMTGTGPDDMARAGYHGCIGLAPDGSYIGPPDCQWRDWANEITKDAGQSHEVRRRGFVDAKGDFL